MRYEVCTRKTRIVIDVLSVAVELAKQQSKDGAAWIEHYSANNKLCGAQVYAHGSCSYNGIVTEQSYV